MTALGRDLFPRRKAYLIVIPSAKSEADPAGISGQACTILGMMAKYWTPGEVKTRLGVDTGNDISAALHRCFVAHLCKRLATLADRREIVVSPTGLIDSMRSLLDDRWQFRPQSGGDLGFRMMTWFAQTLDSARPSHAILIGSDCPDLTPDEVQNAFRLLDDHDIVLGPASDGAYYLIGLCGPLQTRHERLFTEMPWSSTEVLKITCQRIIDMNLSLGLLPERSDVDNIDDLNRLRKQLKKSLQLDESSAELANEICRLIGDADHDPTSEPAR